MKPERRRFVMPEIPAEEAIERQLRTVIRRCGADFTVADLVVATGLPQASIDEALSRLSSEVGLTESVTDRGEVLYHFEGRTLSRDGRRPLTSRLVGSIRNAAGAVAKGALRRLPFFFMSGYFVFFLTFPFPPALILLAVLISSWSDMDLLEFYGSPQRSRTIRGRSPVSMLQEYLRGRAAGRAEGSVNELVAVLAAVRSKMGIISLTDVLGLTGLPPQSAQRYLDELLLRFTGEPAVTTSGRVVYRFPELLKTGARRMPAPAPVISETPRFDRVRKKRSSRKHGIITLINLSNLLFSVYYGTLSVRTMIAGSQSESAVKQLHPGFSVLFNAIYSLVSGAHTALLLPAVFLGLGVIPFGMSTLFLTLHHRAVTARAVERLKTMGRRLRRAVYAQVFANPGSVAPGRLSIPAEVRRHRNAEKSVMSVVDDLAAAFHAEIEDDGEGGYIYHFPELVDEAADLAEMRRSVEGHSFNVGRIVFDARERLK